MKNLILGIIDIKEYKTIFLIVKHGILSVEIPQASRFHLFQGPLLYPQFIQ